MDSFLLFPIATQAEVPDPKWICPDRPRRKLPMSRPSQTQSAYAQTVPDGKWICPDYLAFKTFRAFFVRSKANMSRPSQTETVYVQTFVRFCPDHCALQANSCVQRQNSSASMSRPSCVHVHTFVRSPDLNKLHPGVQCHFLKMMTEGVPKFHKSRCLRFIKKFDFKSFFLYD